MSAMQHSFVQEGLGVVVNFLQQGGLDLAPHNQRYMCLTMYLNIDHSRLSKMENQSRESDPPMTVQNSCTT